jgi:hypothetical protein
VGTLEEVRFIVGNRKVATHPRCWKKNQVFFDPLHYLALLERKPGALDYARPLEEWSLPLCFDVLRRRLEREMQGGEGTREYIKVLRLLEKVTLKALTEAVHQALFIGATGSDAIQLIALHHQGSPVGLFCLDGRPHLKALKMDQINLGAYERLKAEGLG